jgi:hypothetical protein
MPTNRKLSAFGRRRLFCGNRRASSRHFGVQCDERSLLFRHVVIYGLGAVLYTLLSRRAPHTGRAVVVLAAIASGRPVPPLKGVPLALAQTCYQCLEPRPAARLATAAELADAIEHFVSRQR